MKQKWVRKMVSTIAAVVTAISIFNLQEKAVYAADNTVDYMELDTTIGNYATVGTATLSLDRDIQVANSDVKVDDINVPAGKIEVTVNPILQAAYQGTVDVVATFTYNSVVYTETFSVSYNNMEYPDYCSRLVDIQSGSGNSRSSHSSSSSSDDEHEPAHVHDYRWTVIQAPTETEDGIQALKCECGQVDQNSIQSIPRQSATAARNEQIVLHAQPGAAINLNTRDSYSFNCYFIEKLMAHKDSPVNISFLYKNTSYSMAVPAGFDWTRTLNEDGWAGFMYIGSFPGVDLTEAGN